MRFATFTQGDSPEHCVGIVSSDGLGIAKLNISTEQASKGVLALIDLAAQGQDISSLAGPVMPIDAVLLKAPIPQPRRNIFCVGRKYHAHAKELSGSVFKANNADPAAWPIVFTKVPECVVGPNDNVVLPGAVSRQIDYEAEPAVVIGTGGTNKRSTESGRAARRGRGWKNG